MGRPLTEIRFDGSIPPYLVERSLGKSKKYPVQRIDISSEPIFGVLDTHAYQIERGYKELNAEQFVALCDTWMAVLDGVPISDIVKYPGRPTQAVLNTYKSMTIGEEKGAHALIVRGANKGWDYAGVTFQNDQHVREDIVAEVGYRRNRWDRLLRQRGPVKQSWFREREILVYLEEGVQAVTPFFNREEQIGAGRHFKAIMDHPSEEMLKALPRRLVTMYQDVLEQTPSEVT